MHLGSAEVSSSPSPTSQPDAHDPHAKRFDTWAIDEAREQLLLQSAHHLEVVLIRFRYAVTSIATLTATLFQPSRSALFMALLISPLAVNAYVHRSLRHLSSPAQAHRLGRKILAADIVVTFTAYLAFLGDANGVPLAFMPLLVFELAARFDRRGAVAGLTVFAISIGVRMFFQLQLIADGKIRSPLLMLWILLVMLVLILAWELRYQDKMRLAALEERERIAESFRVVIGGVLSRSGVSPQAASWTDVLDAVRRICDGRSTECASLSASIADLLVPAVREFGLTRRERQIVSLLAMGYSYDRIARTLLVSGSTVRNHLHNVRGKLGLSTREEVIAFAREQSLTAVPPPRNP